MERQPSIQTLHSANCSGPVILVADDSNDLLGLLKLGLSCHGFRVVTASNGQEALAKFEIEHFDLLLTDLCMPGVDGNTLAREVKKINGNIPVIALTAAPRLADGAFDSVVIKPFRMSSLVNLINDLLLR